METRTKIAFKMEYHMYNVLRVNNTAICLLCMEVINDDLCCSLKNDGTVVNHMLSEAHKVKVKGFLKKCVPDPKIDSNDPKYENVVNNLVFDMLLSPGRDPCYIFQECDQYHCIFCSKALLKVGTTIEALLSVLIDHLQSESHMKMMNNCICWLYFFKENDCFVMISQSVVYCSICKRQVSTATNSLEALVCHLEEEHGHCPAESEVENVENISTLEKVNFLFESLNTIDADEEENDLPLQENDVSCPDNELSLSDNEYSQSDTDSESDTTASENYDDVLDILTCPDCGELIEVFNENAEFSLQLHYQRHKNLNSINCDKKLAYNSSTDYACPVCHEIIPIFNKDIEISVSHHFEERKIDHEGFIFANDNEEGMSNLIADAFSKLPEVLKKYEKFLTIERGQTVCKLCNCSLPQHKNISDSIHEHVCSSYHEEQFRSLGQDLASAVVDYNKQYQEQQVKQLPDQFETIAKKNLTIKNNKHFIEKKAVHYFCNICQKHISYSPNEAIQTLNFILHLKGTIHETSLIKLATKSSSKEGLQVDGCGKKQNRKQNRALKAKIFHMCRKSVAVNLNQRYLKVKKGKLTCVSCCQSINPSKHHVTTHCSSALHNKQLTTNTSTFMLRYQNQKRSSVSNKNDLQLGTVLSILTNYEFLKPHIPYIIKDKNGCKCVICNVVVPPTKENIIKHFTSTAHKKNAFATNQKMNSLPKQGVKPGKQCLVKSAANVNAKANVPVLKQITSKSPETGQESENITSEANKRAKRMLHQMKIFSTVVKNNFWYVSVKNGMFYCKACHETIASSGSGKHLTNHLKSQGHKNLRK